MRSRKAPSLRRALGKAMVGPLVFLVGTGLSALVFGHLVTPTTVRPGKQASAPTSRATALAVLHGCWSSGEDTPADMEGQFPGHVVVTSNHRTFISKAMVGPALEHVFDGKHPRLRVHAFCR